jgi:hypothetical protein
MYLLSEIVVQDRDIPKHEQPMYTSPLWRIVYFIRSSQGTYALFGGQLYYIAKPPYVIPGS